MSTRRELIRFGFASGIVGLSSLPAAALAQSSAAPRELSLMNTHTGEKLTACYWEKGKYVADACSALNKVLRDHRSGEVHMMDPALFDLLAAMSAKVEHGGTYQIISGYRSPKTNAMLSARSSGVATRSLHMDGKAIDVRLPGVQLARLRDAALSLKTGGVGYYPKSDFVHVDTGRVRQWSGA